MKTRKIRIGSRESKLAVVQSNLVVEAICRSHPEIECELVTMKTTGDRILDRPLDQVGGKGLFVKELDAAMLAGEIDLAVHSLKDMPMELLPGFTIAAYSRREDPRDALLLPFGKEAVQCQEAGGMGSCDTAVDDVSFSGERFGGTWGKDTMPDAAKPIGCSSARRRMQLAQLYPGLRVESVRGNVITRLAKLDCGAYGALVLACAGLRRLGLERRISRIFTPQEMIPAAGQGILAVQARTGDDLTFLDCVEDRQARAAAQAERAFVRALDGGCSAPIAAYAELHGDELHLTGLYADEQSMRAKIGEITGSAADGVRLGEQLAKQLGGAQ